MAWDSKSINYGVLKVEPNGNVKVYRDQYNYSVIQGYKATSAVWAGGEVVLTCSDGTVRKFRDVHNFSFVK